MYNDQNLVYADNIIKSVQVCKFNTRGSENKK